MTKIREVFEQNGYPRKLIDRIAHKVRRSLAANRPRTKPRNDSHYLQLPFISDENCRLVEKNRQVQSPSLQGSLVESKNSTSRVDRK